MTPPFPFLARSTENDVLPPPWLKRRQPVGGGLKLAIKPPLKDTGEVWPPGNRRYLLPARGLVGHQPGVSLDWL